MKKILNIVFILYTVPVSLQAQTFAFDGQVIGWSIVNPSDPFTTQFGGRYIPEFNFSLPLHNLSFDGEFSINAWGAGTLMNPDSSQWEKDLDPYRAWIRLSGNQFEIRAGLQKINFGSASMIRPLMWFDQLDPKDPLRLTKGVYGILGRYYFSNNANIWLWGLYGNNERKGLEFFPNKKNSLEAGGRVQLPIRIGEFALTYHHRTADPDAVLPSPSQLGEYCPENRYAIDAKVDLGIGIWIEAALIRKKNDLLPLDNNTLLNAGMDYTFNIGNGIHILAEGLYYMQGEEAFQSNVDALFTGISISYPLSIIHNLSAIVFIDARNKEFYRFVNWSMIFDRWSFYTIAFWNPDSYRLPGFETETNIFSGAGVQLMAVFNY